MTTPQPRPKKLSLDDKLNQSAHNTANAVANFVRKEIAEAKAEIVEKVEAARDATLSAVRKFPERWTDRFLDWWNLAHKKFTVLWVGLILLAPFMLGAAFSAWMAAR